MKALVTITGRDFGEDSLKWIDWWKQNQTTLRTEGESSAGISHERTECNAKVETYIAGLSNMDSYIKAGSAAALGEIGDSCAVEPLIEALKDTNSGVKLSVIAALKKITGKDFGDDSRRWQEWWDQNKSKP